MGTRFAPCFANLYVGDFEKDFIYGNHGWKENIIFFKRYIDDLIFIWNGSTQDFETKT